MTDKLTIHTNNVPRPVLRWYELTDAERADFGEYIDTEQKQDEAEFVRYKGTIYDLHDMERGCGMSEIPPQFEGWDDYQSDSFSSGILIRWVGSECEQVVCATYFS